MRLFAIWPPATNEELAHLAPFYFLKYVLINLFKDRVTENTHTEEGTERETEKCLPVSADSPNLLKGQEWARQKPAVCVSYLVVGLKDLDQCSAALLGTLTRSCVKTWSHGY